TAGLASEDAVFVLHADKVDGIDVQEVRCTPIRCEVALGDLEPDSRRISVAPSRIVHREDVTFDRRKLAGDRVGQVGREGRDPALTRQIIADKGDRPEGPRRTRHVLGHGTVSFWGPRKSHRSSAGVVASERLGPGSDDSVSAASTGFSGITTASLSSRNDSAVAST